MKDQYTLLMVDDEPNVLSGYQRSLGRKYNIVTAEGAQAGLDAIREHGSFPIVITDMRMPGMDGLAFLKAAHRTNKRGVYIMLTGNADQQTAINAINEGQIFRFLNKPCSGEQLDLAIQACIKQYELIEAEHLLLRDTLAGSIKLLTQIVTLTDPRMAQTNEAVGLDAIRIAKHLGIPVDWRLSISAMLCMIGSAVVDSGATLNTLSEDTLDRHARIGANLIRHIPKLGEVAEIIARQREVLQLPESLDMSDMLSKGDPAPRLAICSSILRLAVDYRRALCVCKLDRQAAFGTSIEGNDAYDARLIEACRLMTQECVQEHGMPEGAIQLRLPIAKLKPGMSVTENVTTKDGKPLLVKGSTLTAVVIERLKELQITKLYAGEIAVLVPSFELGQEAA